MDFFLVKASVLSGTKFLVSAPDLSDTVVWVVGAPDLSGTVVWVMDARDLSATVVPVVGATDLRAQCSQARELQTSDAPRSW